MEKLRQKTPLFPSTTPRKDTKHQKKPSNAYEDQFEHYYHNPTSTVIRPEQNHRINAGEQL